jgi:uncharacterized protein YjbI with pentapeptide repeats
MPVRQFISSASTPARMASNPLKISRMLRQPRQTWKKQRPMPVSRYEETHLGEIRTEDIPVHKLSPNRLGVVLAMAAFSVAALPDHAQAGCRSHPGPGVDWTKCYKERLILSGKDMKKAVFNKAYLAGTDFSSADLRHASFEGAEVTRSSFRNAKLQGAKFSRAYGSRINFNKADLSGGMLSKAELQRSNFSETNLKDADLSQGDFFRAVFDRADLTGANLNRANLSRASFRNAILTKVDFTLAYMYHTDLQGADLSAVSGLTQQQIAIICTDSKTKLPTGLIAPISQSC